MIVFCATSAVVRSLCDNTICGGFSDGVCEREKVRRERGRASSETRREQTEREPRLGESREPRESRLVERERAERESRERERERTRAGKTIMS